MNDNQRIKILRKRLKDIATHLENLREENRYLDMDERGKNYDKILSLEIEYEMVNENLTELEYELAQNN